MNKTVLILLMLALMLVSADASADDRIAVVAVFNVEFKGISLPPDVVERLSDYLSGRMGEGGKFLVVPRDRIKDSLTRQKTDSYRECYAQSCQIELGLELAANKTLAAQILQLGSQCRVSLALYDLAIAATENAATASGGCTTDAIVSSIDLAVARLLGLTASLTPGKGIPAESASTVAPPPPDVEETHPRISGGQVTVAHGDLTIQGKTRQGTPVRLEVTDPNGKLTVSGSPFKDPVAVIGTWKVVAKASGHEEQARKIEVPADESVLEKIELIPFGGLRITGEPAGAQVTVSGPNGFSNTGGLPWTGEGLHNGQYKIGVRRDGYEDYSMTASITDGRTTDVVVRLLKKQAVIEYREGVGPGWGFQNLPNQGDGKWGWIKVTSNFPVCGVEDSVDSHRARGSSYGADEVWAEFTGAQFQAPLKYYRPPMYFRVTPGERAVVLCYQQDEKYAHKEVDAKLGIVRPSQFGKYFYEFATASAGQVREVHIDSSDKEQFTCMGSCPWVYLIQGDRQIRIDEILKDVKGNQMQRWANLRLPGTKGQRTVSVRIAEEIPGETTFLDAVRLSVGNVTVGPAGTIPDGIAREDGVYLKMPTGDSLTLTFELSEPAADDVVIQATGYYETVAPSSRN